MASSFWSAGRLRELVSKYGKVAVAVHCTVSGISITSFYIAIKNNVDVEGVLQKIGFSSLSSSSSEENQPHYRDAASNDNNESSQLPNPDTNEHSNTQLVTSGGALALAIICNKVLLPVRIPITIVLTPPVARFLARRKLYKAGDV